MTTLKAYRIFNEDGKVAGRFTDMKLEELDAGDVVIKVAYSSVNFKDALAATGAGKIIRRFPCVGGVDLSGTVVESADARFRKGDAVIATSYDIGVAHDGGYAEYARIPAGLGGADAEGTGSVRSDGAGDCGIYRCARGRAHGARGPETGKRSGDRDRRNRRRWQHRGGHSFRHAATAWPHSPGRKRKAIT